MHCFVQPTVFTFISVSHYIMFKCKQLSSPPPPLEFPNNSSAYYNFKDVSWQLQTTFKKKLCAGNYHISSTLWQMVLVFWLQFSLRFCKPTSCGMRIYIFWAKYSKVDTNWGLLAFSSSLALGHMSIESARFLLFLPNS